MPDDNPTEHERRENIMDPITALTDAFNGSRQAARDYNDWVERGGFRARVALEPGLRLWMVGVRYVDVVRVGTIYVYGVHVESGHKVRLPIARVDIVS